jgi:Flp pilus assembly protein CpaB
VATAVEAASAPPEALVPVVVADRDLAGGRRLGPEDLTTVPFLAASLPKGTLGSEAAALGRVLAAPLRSGEPVTDVRLVAPGLLDGYPGLVAAPVRIADSGTVRLLRVGDRIDVVAADPERGGAAVVARAASVVAVPRTDRDHDGIGSGGLLVVAVTSADAVLLAELAVSSVLSVVLTG